MEEWLNDTTVDGFLGNLRQPEKFIKMDSKWNASQMSNSNKPPSESEEGTVVEDPVGLLNLYEYAMSCRGTTTVDSYINNSLFWSTLTPYDDVNIRVFDGTGRMATTTVAAFASGVRPSLNLKPTIKIVSGRGTEDNPYRLEGDNDTNLEGTKLNTRYSGEYIRFGSDENNLYRIVSHETDSLTKVTSSESLKENGSFKSIAFDINGNVSFTSNNTIGTFLNGEYLNSGKYLTNEQLDMLEDNTEWYIGYVESGENYRLAKYTDISMTSTTTNVTAKVGLLRLGELMSGQFSEVSSNNRYQTLTPFSSKAMRSIDKIGHSGYNVNVEYQLGVKPAFNLKSNVIITSGTGTLNDPFTLSV